jgi:CDP-diacylglycerol pyrophosphatase
MRRFPSLTGLSVAAALAALFLAPRTVAAAPAGANDLWVQVNTCIQNAIKTGFPMPPNPPPVPTPTCFYVQPQGLISNIGDGFAILKDIKPQIYHFLTTPTKAITGIEDPQVEFFVPGKVNTSYSPNYWVDAWLWLSKTVAPIYLAKNKVALRPDQMGVAINSVMGRSENQLHMHMACLDKNVQPLLTAAKVTTTWSAAIQLKNGHSYHAIVLGSLSSNPFLVMQSVPGFKPADIGKETLLVTGKPSSTQFYLIEDYAHGSDPGHTEELLDEDCAFK